MRAPCTKVGSLSQSARERIGVYAGRFMRSAILGLSLLACGTSHSPDGGASSYGDPCGDEAPCNGGLSCVSSGAFPGGYCTRTCPDGTCPGEADCDTGTDPALCLARCAAPADCRDGYQCWRGNCRPQCARDADCGEGATCEEGVCAGAECLTDADCGPMERCALGSCVVLSDDAGTMRPEGAPCALDSECASGICLPPELGGVCTIACGEPSICVTVPFEAGCAPIGSGGALRTACAALPPSPRDVGRACEADVECRSRACQDGQCTAVCANETDCVNGQICTALSRAGGTFQGCGYTAGPSSGITIEEIDLGENTLGAGFPAALELAIPADAVSVTLQTRAVSGDPLDLTFITVTSPSADTIFDVADIFDLIDPPERWLPIDAGEAITMLVPNTTGDRLQFHRGLYAWSVSPIPRMMGDTGSVVLRSSALLKRSASRTATGGSIDLHVHLAGIGVSAASAPTDTRLQNALTRLTSILSAQATISVRNVSYFDVTDARFSIIDSTDGPTSELAALFRTSAPRTGRTLNIFLVRSINRMDDGSFQALGIAGGIPGPVGIHGTMHSGVVAAYESSGSGSVLGHVLAHEIGHYLGLYHPTESLRPCGPGEMPPACAPFGGGDVLADTPRGDDTNLMYWSISGGGTNVRLSEGQAFVLRLSALVAP